DYVKVLEGILSSGNISAIRFFKKAEFTFSQKEEAEKTLFKTLKIVISKDDIHAITAKRLINNFDKFISTFSVQQYWNSLNVRIEKTITSTAQIILQEKEEQNACQIRCNMLEKNIKSLTRKRSDVNDFEEKRTSKKQNINKLAFDDEVDFDDNEIFSMDTSIVFTDNDTDEDYEEILSNYEEYCEEETQTDVASADTIGSWVLSSGKDVGKELSKYRENIPRTKAYLYPAYFGILDLSGEDTEVKKLFTDDEWNEMIKDFNNNVKLSDMEDEQERPFYELMDKISEILMKKPFDLITGIESCVIEVRISLVLVSYGSADLMFVIYRTI
ncbi:7142_t:CDS:2, partial [Ambispora gerdemannii]